MSEQIQPDTNEEIGGDGFELESGQPEEASLPIKPIRNRNKIDEIKRNLVATFGSGIGKISLIFIGIAVITFCALGYRGLSRNKKENSSPTVDVPPTPQQKTNMDAISPQEAARRNQRAAIEAQEAAAQGDSYIASFNTNIAKEEPQTLKDAGQLMQMNIPPVKNSNTGSGTPDAGGRINVSTGSQTANSGNQGQNSQKAAHQQRLEKELEQAQSKRDKYVLELREQVLKQAEGLFQNDGQGGGLNAVGVYSTVAYYPTMTNNLTEVSDAGNSSGSGIEHPKGKLLIKTGKLLYATLDSEVNTDDGNVDVLATIHGGTWDGSKLIGHVEQGPNNIRLKFSTMAPQDERPTMKINAVALREEDAKQGVAETIDHHTLERYTALAVSSLLSGYGRAYSTTPGTTVATPGGVTTTTTTEPSNKQIIGMSVGEMGQAMSQEIRRGFNRSTTYATPARKGIGVFFLEDVTQDPVSFGNEINQNKK